MFEEGLQVFLVERNDGFRRVYSNSNLGEEQGVSLEEVWS